MSELTKSTNTVAEVPAGREKPAYEPPAVVELGNVREGRGQVADCMPFGSQPDICASGGAYFNS